MRRDPTHAAVQFVARAATPVLLVVAVGNVLRAALGNVGWDVPCLWFLAGLLNLRIDVLKTGFLMHLEGPRTSAESRTPRGDWINR